MDYQYIGKITGTHGLDGKIIVRHQLEGKNTWNKIPHVFIEVRRESYIPYFIEGKSELNHEEMMLKVDEVDSVESARMLSGKKVYLDADVFAKLQPKAISGDMIGFKIIDREIGEIGLIDDLFETPGQVLASVQFKGKELLVPLIDATIQHIDGIKKTITVALPDGLIDVYM